MNSFIRRHPVLKIEGTVITERARADACSLANLEPFYHYYSQLLAEYKFPETLIFNLDETNVNFNDKFRSSSIVRQTDPPAICAQPDRITGLTLVFCMPAEGKPLPATLLWPHPNIPEEFKSFGAKGIRVQCSSSAWQTRDSFEEMMIHRYIPEMIGRRELLELKTYPILLLLDGHLSRLSVKFIKCCVENNIFVLILPAHSSSITQPCDCAPFAVLKAVFAKESAIRVNGCRSQLSRSRPKTDLQTDGREKSSTASAPPVISERESYTKTSAGHRRLIAECLPLALEAASEFSTMKEGWRKSALVPFSMSILKERAQPGGIPVPASRISPNISGKLLTAPETKLQVWSWRLKQIDKILTSLKTNSDEKQLLEEERTMLESDISAIQANMNTAVEAKDEKGVHVEGGGVKDEKGVHVEGGGAKDRTVPFQRKKIPRRRDTKRSSIIPPLINTDDQKRRLSASEYMTMVLPHCDDQERQRLEELSEDEKYQYLIQKVGRIYDELVNEDGNKQRRRKAPETTAERRQSQMASAERRVRNLRETRMPHWDSDYLPESVFDTESDFSGN